MGTHSLFRLCHPHPFLPLEITVHIWINYLFVCLFIVSRYEIEYLIHLSVSGFSNISTSSMYFVLNVHLYWFIFYGSVIFIYMCVFILYMIFSLVFLSLMDISDEMYLRYYEYSINKYRYVYFRHEYVLGTHIFYMVTSLAILLQEGR